jgi:hypothetical protein
MTGIESGLNPQMLQMIGAAAMETVGAIEVMKNFFKPQNKKVWTIVMMPLALLFCAVYSYLPIWVTAGILAICACQICWDTILQTFKRIIGKLGGDNQVQGHDENFHR